MIKKILVQLQEYKAAAIATPIFAASEVVVELLMPYVMAFIIDRGINAGNIHNVYLYGLLMLGCAFLALFLGIMAAIYSAKSATGLGRNLRATLFEKIQTFSFANIDKFSTGGLVTRLTTDVTNVQNAFQMVTRIAVRAPLMFIMSLVMSIAISGRLSLIFAVAIVILAGTLIYVMTHTIPVFKEVFNRYDDLNAVAQENITAIRVVKAFVRQDFENSKFGKAAYNLYNLFVKAETTLIINMPVMMLVIYGCTIALSWFGAHFIVGGTLTTGELTAMFSYVMSTLMSLMMLSMVFVMITMSLASARRIVEVMDEESTIVNPQNPVLQVKDGSIDFNQVDFAYGAGSGENTLSNIDLHIGSGETIGIIGGTGSGKSSLVSLISRLYDVKAGSVLVGGVDVREYDLDVLRNKVAVVLQKNELFSGTILDNLRWGDPQATEEECRQACEQACAHEFIERMPEGYNTWIERGGSNVSGGQKQRLCIARALLKKPAVLILDDSTSAVDTATDAKIRQGLRTAIPSTTKLIIAQRISSVMDADRILVLDDGRINGFDTHANLLASNAIYAEIYETQMQAGGDFDETSEDSFMEASAGMTEMTVTGGAENDPLDTGVLLPPDIRISFEGEEVQ